MAANAFPFLDMELFWKNGELAFCVHKKPNQQLKYLNSDSTHPSATSKEIQHGVFPFLANLTSQDLEMGNKRIDEVYPEHVDALWKARLCTEELLTFGDLLTKFKDGREERELQRHKQQKNARRQCFFVVGYSRVWTTPIHAILNWLRCKYGFKWLHLSTVYTCHSNLASLINTNTGSKLMAGIIEEVSRDRPCN